MSRGNSSKLQSGTSILEMILALSLFALLLPSIATLIASGYSGFAFAKQRHHHLVIAKNELDIQKAKLLIYKNITATSTTADIGDGILKTITIRPRDTYAMDISIKVVDSKLPLNFQKKTSIMLSEMVKISGLESNSSCELNLNPSISPPTLRERARVLIPSSNEITGMVVRYPYAFLTTNDIATSSPDLFVFDVASTTHPTIISSLDTGRGLSGAVISYPYLFAITDVISQHVQIFDVTNPESPLHIRNFRLQDIGSSSPPKISTITYGNKLLYLGTEKWDGPELMIVNVEDVLHPEYLGGYEIGSLVKGITLSAGDTYLATAGEDELKIIDASDPQHITTTGNFNPSGWEVMEGNHIVLDGESLYFARAGGGFNSPLHHEFYIFSQNTLPQFPINSYTSFDIPKGVYGIIPYYPFVIMGTASSGGEILIKNILQSGSTTSVLPLNALPRKIICDERFLYSILEDENSFTIHSIN